MNHVFGNDSPACIVCGGEPGLDTAPDKCPGKPTSSPPPGRINPSISDTEWEARQEVEARFLHGYYRRFGKYPNHAELRGTIAEAAFIASFQVSEVVRTLNKWAAEDK